MMKYEKPVAEIIAFNNSDVVTASGEGDYLGYCTSHGNHQNCYNGKKPTGWYVHDKKTLNVTDSW